MPPLRGGHAAHPRDSESLGMLWLYSAKMRKCTNKYFIYWVVNLVQ